MIFKVLSFGCSASLILSNSITFLLHLYFPCLPPFIGSFFRGCEQFPNPLYSLGILLLEVIADYYFIVNGIFIAYFICLLGVVLMMRYLQIMNG
jgi:hypothetical protein